MVDKVCFGSLYENVSEILTGNNCSGCKGYNCPGDLFFVFEGAY